MKQRLSFSFLLILIIVGCDRSANYKVDNYYTKAESDSVLLQMMPYIADLPSGANDSTKFTQKFRERYKLVMKNNYTMENYFINEDSVHYYLVWEMAPSIEKIAIGGSFRLDENKNIYDFEEIFYTPKMLPEKLRPLGDELFGHLASTGNVDPYLGDYSKIEFPSHTVCYDKELHKWKICVNDKIRELY